MTESFAAFLERERPRVDTVVQAARFYLAMRTDDLPVEDMKAELRAASSEESVDEALDELSRSPATLADAAAAVLSSAWAEPEGPGRVRNAFQATHGKLPVVEAGILAVSVMYGVYLLVSRSMKRSTKVTVRHPDGTVVEYEDKEYFGPAGPLSSLVRALPPDAQPPQPGPPPGAP